MVVTVTRFFRKYIKANDETGAGVSEHALRIATAALLVEMMRADSRISDEEKGIIHDTLKRRFELSEEETGALISLAEEKIWASTGYFEFTRLMNRGFSYEQKVRVVENLWEVAFADNILDKYEEYMVRKIADLIYVSHSDFIDAKLRIKKRLGNNL